MSVNNFPENINSGDASNTSKLSAPIAFVQSLEHQVNEEDIYNIIQSQKHMLARFEKTNEMLVNCNSLLTARHVGASKELKKQIAFLVDLKKDLESIFRRIRFLKMKLSQQYTEAFAASSTVFNVLDEEEEQEEKEVSPDKHSDETERNAVNVSSSGSRASTPRSTSPSTSDT